MGLAASYLGVGLPKFLVWMEEIWRLFVLLPHQEQLRVLERLPALIKVDFIANLPLLVVTRIVSYLPIRDVMNCSLVCWKWRSVVFDDCRGYWIGVCTDAGLSDAYVNGKIKQYPSIVSFALVAHQHMERAKKLLLSATIMWKLNASANVGYINVSSYGLPLVYDLFLFTYMKRKNLIHLDISSSVPKKRRPPFQISWAGVYEDSVIIATNNAEWVETEDHSIKQQWIDSEVVASYQTRFDICSQCGFVLQAHRDTSTRNNMLDWIISGVMLMKEKAKTYRLHSAINLLSIDVNLKNNDAIFLQNVAIVPVDSADTVSQGFCSNHLLLLQFNSAIVAYTITFECDVDEGSLYPVLRQTFVTGNSITQCLLDLTNRDRSFRLSLTNNVLALISSSSLFIWRDISHLSEQQPQPAVKISLTPLFQKNTNDVELIAVGDMYCILQRNLEVVVVSTLTGAEVFSGFLENNGGYLQRAGGMPNLTVNYCCVQQDWMNDFCCST